MELAEVQQVKMAEFSPIFLSVLMNKQWMMDLFTLIKPTMNNQKTGYSLWTIHECFNVGGALIFRGVEILLLSQNN